MEQPDFRANKPSWLRRQMDLPAGWRLVLAPGLPSADGRYHTREKFEARIGDIAPFELKSAEMRHLINQRPELEITFSKPLPPALTNTHAQWIHIAPPPEKLEARVTGRSLRLAGDWRRDTTYSVTLLRGFPADEAFQLSEPVALRVEVPPVAPRLYFPAFITEQYAGGGRSFSLLAVNVPKVRLRAKRLDPETFIHALRGYQAYHSSFTWPEGYRRQNYELVPGRTVFSAELEGANQPDAACEIKLDWDRLLQGRKTGVVFLEAERLSEVVPLDIYDLVYSFGVIHHTPHPENVIAQIRRYVGSSSLFKMMVYHRYSYKVLWILLTQGKGAFWKLDELIARYSEAQTGCPVTYSYSRKTVRDLLKGFTVVTENVEHIFPYSIPEYKRYEYRKAWPFRWMPDALFRSLERRWGWHLCVTARPQSGGSGDRR